MMNIYEGDYDPHGWIIEELPAPFNRLNPERDGGEWLTAEEAAQRFGVSARTVREVWAKELHPEEVLEPLKAIEYVYDFELPGWDWSEYWKAATRPPVWVGGKRSWRWEQIGHWNFQLERLEVPENVWLPDQDLTPDECTDERASRTAFFHTVDMSRYERDEEGRWKRTKDDRLVEREAGPSGWDLWLEPISRVHVEVAPKVYWEPALADIADRNRENRRAANPGQARGARGRFVKA